MSQTAKRTAYRAKLLTFVGDPATTAGGACFEEDGPLAGRCGRVVAAGAYSAPREWLTPELGAGTLVALEGGVIVGFCSFGPSRDDDADERTAEVRTIYLREEVAGRGIGRDLFASANDRLHDLGYRRATLWVMASNEQSRRFYERSGWSWDGTTSAHRFDCGNVPIVRYTAQV